MKASLVIMAAGMGARYGGNKQIDGVGPNSEMLMEYSIYDAVRAGFEKIVLIIKPEIETLVRGMVDELLGKLRTAEGKAVEVHYVYQTFDSIPAFYQLPAARTKPFGTCHALLCAKDVIAEPFAVLNADDYYGSDAFRGAYDALCRMSAEHHAAMVGYHLGKTVSEHGAVTRGICVAEGNDLRGVVETYQIRRGEDGLIRSEDGTVLAEDAAVSMNFWCFTPWIFTRLESYFHNFLRALPPQSDKGECLLPTMVDELLKRGELKVEVLKSEERWFGVTYREDKPIVQEELRKLHEKGIYPATLA